MSENNERHKAFENSMCARACATIKRVKTVEEVYIKTLIPKKSLLCSLFLPMKRFDDIILFSSKIFAKMTPVFRQPASLVKKVLFFLPFNKTVSVFMKFHICCCDSSFFFSFGTKNGWHTCN